VMREGKIHQIGTPACIYERPADTFVATFIGSPEMNLYKGSLVRNKGHFEFKGNEFFLDLTAVRKDLKEDHIELGFRPEDIKVGDTGGVLFNTEIEMMSNVGSEKYIYGRLGREMLTARILEGFECKLGSIVTFSIDPARLHFFANGLRI